MVWYRPEPRPGRDKLEPSWKGPGVVLENVGNHSYVVEVKQGRRQHAHRTQLRPHQEDEFSGDQFPLFYFSGRAAVVDDMGPDEFIVDKVVGHQLDPKTGGFQFRIRWQGYGEKDDSWEPAAHVVSEPVRQYLADHKLRLAVASGPKAQAKSK